MNINSLPDEVRSKIRGGMKITSLLRCVQELIYNSLDAKSTSIAIRINMATYNIQVIDNGTGIKESNLTSLGLPYMTSKCAKLDDINRLSKYYGYKGESLRNVMYVSERIRLTSRTSNTKATYEIDLKTREIRRINNRASSGVTVTIENLFYNLPVRKKRTSSTEFDLGELKKELRLLSLVHHDVSITLRNEVNKELVFYVEKCPSITSRIIIEHSNAIEANDLFEIKYTKKKQLKILGLISKKTVPIDIQLFYVNKRSVMSSTLNDITRNVLKKSTIEKLNNLNYLYVVYLKCCYGDINLNYDSKRTRIDFNDWNRIESALIKCIVNGLKSNDLWPNLNEDLNVNLRSNVTNAPLCDVMNERSSVKLSEISGICKSNWIRNRTNFPRNDAETSKNLRLNLAVECQKTKETNDVIVVEDVNLKTELVKKTKQKQKKKHKKRDIKAKTNDKIIDRRQVKSFFVEYEQTANKHDVSNENIVDVQNSFENNESLLRNDYGMRNERIVTDVREMVLKPTGNETTNGKDFIMDMFLKSSRVYGTRNVEETQPNYRKNTTVAMSVVTTTSIHYRKITDFHFDKYPIATCSKTGDKIKTNKLTETNKLTKRDKLTNVTNDSSLLRDKQKKIYVDKGIQTSALKETHSKESVRNKVNSFRLNPTIVSRDTGVDKRRFRQLVEENKRKQVPRFGFDLNDCQNVFNVGFRREDSLEAIYDDRQCEDLPSLSIRDNVESNITQNFQNLFENLKKKSKNTKKNIKKREICLNPFAKQQLRTDADYLSNATFVSHNYPIRDEEETRFTRDFVEERTKNEHFKIVKKCVKSQRKTCEISLNYDAPVGKILANETSQTDYKNSKPLHYALNNSDIKAEINDEIYEETIDEIIEVTPNKKRKIKIHQSFNKQEDLDGFTTDNRLDRRTLVNGNGFEDGRLNTENYKLKIPPIGSDAFYLDKATGMTYYKRPIDAIGYFTLKKRADFLPKGMSPILDLKEKSLVSLSDTCKRQLTEALIQNETELNEIKWQNCNNDYATIYAELYYEKCKRYEQAIPEMKRTKISVKIDRNVVRHLSVIGQWDHKFIVAKSSSDDQLYVLDQHAVHERIRIEKLLREAKDGTNFKTHAKRFVLQFTNDDLRILIEYAKYFASQGIVYDMLKNGLLVTNIPECLYKKYVETDTLKQIVKLIIDEELTIIRSTRGVASKTSSIIQNVLNMDACRGAIKFGDVLTLTDCEDLLNELIECDLPFQCAHGRPTIVPLMLIGNDDEKRPKPRLRQLLSR